MKTIQEFTIILSISILSLFLNKFIPLPASIIALLILLIMLLTGIINQRKIKSTANFFLQCMPLFFIPATVKIIVDYKFVEKQLTIFLLICIITTILTFFVSGNVVKYTIFRMEKKHGKRH